MKKNSTFIFLALILLSFTTIKVNAENITPATKITGSTLNSFGCNSSSYYCYGGAGIRLSLYYYNSQINKINKIGYSHDIWSNKLTYPSDSNKSWTNKSIYHYSSLGNNNDSISNRISNGTTWYSNNNQWIKCTKNCKNITNKYTVFSLDYNKYAKSGIVEKTNKFGDFTTSNNEEFRQWINDYLNKKITKEKDVVAFFGDTITTGQLSNYYITAEPIFRLWINTSTPDKKNQYNAYIGTVFELSKIYQYPRYSNSIKSTTGKSGEFVGDILLPTSKKTGTTTNGNLGNGTIGTATQWRVLNKYAYGVGVYKLNDFVTGCACNGDYKCTLNYCSKAKNRKTCATSCGVNDPEFTSCSKDTKPSDSITNCDDTKKIELKSTTCEKANGATYYKVNCTETNKINYSNTLPITIRIKEGFEYNVTLTGTKTCTLSFDKKKWEYDYLVSNDKSRETLINRLNSYNKISSDNLDSLKYQKDTSINIKINDETSKELIKTSEGQETERFSNSKKSNLITEKKVYTNKTYTNEIKSITYKLPYKCLSPVEPNENVIFDNASSKYVCQNQNDTGPYNKYYTSDDTKEGRNNTLVTITKSNLSSTNITNSCYYNTVESKADYIPPEIKEEKETEEETDYCPSNLESVNEYCQTETGEETDETNSCIQTCLCSKYNIDWTSKEDVSKECNISEDNKDACRLCPNISKSNKIVYRPISLTDPFPNNRIPGANWRGYVQDVIISKKIDYDNPEYVVTLNPQDIQSIKNYVKDYNSRTKGNAYVDYVDATKDGENREYTSEFIHKTYVDLFKFKTSSSSGGGS